VIAPEKLRELERTTGKPAGLATHIPNDPNPPKHPGKRDEVPHDSKPSEPW
jgi:hypothetical protein